MNRKLDAHVIAWKRTFHVFPDRILTAEEWEKISKIPKECRFKSEEEIESGRFFWSYTRNSKNGIFTPTEEKFKISREKSRQSSRKRADKQKEYARKKYRENSEAVIKRTSEYQKKNLERGRIRQRVWKAENPDKVKQYYKTEWQKTKKNPEKVAKKLERNRSWRIKNKKYAQEQGEKWRKNNPEKYKAQCRRTYQNRKANPERHLMSCLRDRLKKAVRNKLLSGRAADKESVKFLIWLATYKNIDYKNGYHIDHIIPLKKCDLSTKDGQVFANSPENVRWMTRKENLQKCDEMPSQLEIDEHLKLVVSWREEVAKTTISIPVGLSQN